MPKLRNRRPSCRSSRSKRCDGPELTHGSRIALKIGEKRPHTERTDANLAYHSVLEGEAVGSGAHMIGKSGDREVVKDDAMIG